MTLSVWILSIAGITVFSVIVDLFLPDGQTNSLIKSIFSYLIIFVIISPIPQLVKIDLNANTIFIEQELQLQDNYIFQLNRYKLDAIQEDIVSAIKQENIDGVNISISANIFTHDMQIDAVFVDLFDLVINKNNQHIDIKKTIIECIQNLIKIEKENIIFNE